MVSFLSNGGLLKLSGYVGLECFPNESGPTAKIFSTFIFNLGILSSFSLFFSFHPIRSSFLEEICHGEVSSMVIFCFQRPGPHLKET